MDINLTLKNFENSLRDLISSVLTKTKGSNWFENCGLSENRIQSWKDAQEREFKRIKNADERLIYYAEFFDLKEVIKKNWDVEFHSIFKSKKEFEVLFDILEQYRNPEAHRRELMPYQKQLIFGVSGKLRTEITKYFSQMETGESYYSRFESVQDNLNNSWIRGKQKVIDTLMTLRVGDKLQFTLTASDPKGDILQFAVLAGAVPYKFQWKTSNTFELEIEKNHVGDKIWITFVVKSNREYHAMGSVGLGKVDDEVKFGYEVLPPR